MFFSDKKYHFYSVRITFFLVFSTAGYVEWSFMMWKEPAPDGLAL